MSDHVHGGRCVTDYAYCPDRMHDEILIRTPEDLAFWNGVLPGMSGVNAIVASPTVATRISDRWAARPSGTYVPPNCTRDFACCSGDHECEYRLSREVLDTCTGETAANAAAFNHPEMREPLTRVGVLHQGHFRDGGVDAGVHDGPAETCTQCHPGQVRTLREILFNHRTLAGATALEITELMAELQPLFKDGA